MRGMRPIIGGIELRTIIVTIGFKLIVFYDSKMN